MRELLLDIGNSKIAAALAVDGRMQDRVRVPHAEELGGRREASIARVHDWCADKLSDGGLHRVGIASVEPALLELWTRLWEQRSAAASVPVTTIDHGSSLPFRIAIENPETIGADRLCNVAAAMRRGARTAIVVGLGTAHTYDMMVDGVFEGGLIAPGARVAHEAMLSRGARLPVVDFGPPSQLVGRLTEEALRSGAFHQSLGGILYVLYRLQTRHPGAAMVVTGGGAHAFVAHLPDDALFVADLTLEGILTILRHGDSQE